MKDFSELKEHVNYLNFRWLNEQGVKLPNEAKQKAKEYQKKYFEKKLQDRRN